MAFLRDLWDVSIPGQRLAAVRAQRAEQQAAEAQRQRQAEAFKAIQQGNVMGAAAYDPQLAGQYLGVQAAQDESAANNDMLEQQALIRTSRAIREAEARLGDRGKAFDLVAPRVGQALGRSPEELAQVREFFVNSEDPYGIVEAALVGPADQKGRYISTRGGIFDTQTREIIASPEDPLMGARRNLLANQADAAAALAEQRRTPKSAPTTAALQTPGRKKVDERYADRYLEWREQGSASVAANLDRLGTAVEALESGENLTGPVMGAVTDPRIRALYAPKSADIQQQVEEVVQQSLRSILGGQFAQKEGEQLVARAYNPRLGEQENAARVRRLVGLLQSAADAKESQAQYFEENGTLAGWEGMDVGEIRKAINAAFTGAEGDPFREGDNTSEDAAALVPEGIDAAVWEYMAPEERALFQ